MNVAGLIVVVLGVLALVQLGRMGWAYFVRGSDEMVAGGSWGLQIFGRRPEKWKHRAH